LSDNLVTISIADNGKGIDQDNLDNIFDPFFTTKEIGEGIGLGLSISYGIIQEHKGQIDVDSQIGIGTTIKIALPVKQEK
jgi:signal transduction histidine kinase